MTRTPLLALYSLAHFWVDLSCAFLAFRFLSAAPEFTLCLLLYNFCAFALQMPLGLWADSLDRNGMLAAAGCGLTFLYKSAAAAELKSGKLVEVKIEDMNLKHDYSFVWRKDSIYEDEYLEIMSEITT